VPADDGFLHQGGLGEAGELMREFSRTAPQNFFPAIRTRKRPRKKILRDVV